MMDDRRPFGDVERQEVPSGVLRAFGSAMLLGRVRCAQVTITFGWLRYPPSVVLSLR